MKRLLVLIILFVPKLVFGAYLFDDSAYIKLEDINQIKENNNILKYEYGYHKKISYYKLIILKEAQIYLENPKHNIEKGEKDQSGNYIFKVTDSYFSKKYALIELQLILNKYYLDLFNIFSLSSSVFQLIDRDENELWQICNDFSKCNEENGQILSPKYFVALYMLAEKGDKEAKKILEENASYGKDNTKYLFGGSIDSNTKIRKI